MITITPALISQVTAVSSREDFYRITSLDLHLRDTAHSDHSETSHAKIRKIENLHLVPNLTHLNLSYNAISRIEGLDRLSHLIELNLAENLIVKIENLGNLSSLERLNLSGNQIQRIPESIASLSRLTHLRLARNQLNKVEDVLHLGKLSNLSNLRIDENPFSQTSTGNDYELYTIFFVPSLMSLNGREISAEKRSQADALYALDHISAVRSKLASEQHRLTRLKRELQQSPEKAITMHAALSRDTLHEVEEANRLLTIRLSEIAAVEAEIDRLEALLGHYESTSRGDPLKQPVSPTKETSFPLSKSKPITPSSAQSLSVALSQLRASPVQAVDIATKQIVDLTDRVERLSSKVLTAEKEKLGLQHQLERVDRLKDDLLHSEESLERALDAAQTANEDLKQVTRELDLTKALLKTSEDSLTIKTLECDKLTNENQRLVKELRDALERLQNHEEFVKEQPHLLRATLSSNSFDESRAKLITQRADIQDLESENSQLKFELEKLRSQLTLSSSEFVRNKDEIDSFKRKISSLERDLKDCQSENLHLESENRALKKSLQVTVSERLDLEKTIEKLELHIHVLEDAERNSKGSREFKENVRGTSTSTVVPRRILRKAARTYFDAESSTDCEEPAQNTQVSPSKKKISSLKRRLSPARVTINEVERSAAEIMAQIMVEELLQGSGGGRESIKDGVRLTENSLKTSCIRAALRLVYTSSRLVNGSDDEDEDPGEDEDLEETPGRHNDRVKRRLALTPFHVLGDRDFLSKLVTDTHAGLAALEESLLLKDEVRQLQVMPAPLPSTDRWTACPGPHCPSLSPFFSAVETRGGIAVPGRRRGPQHSRERNCAEDTHKTRRRGSGARRTHSSRPRGLTKTTSIRPRRNAATRRRTHSSTT